MMDWYSYSVIALLLLGTQRFLYKVAAEQQCRSALTTTVFMATVALLSTLTFFAGDDHAVRLPTLVVLALLNSGAFALATVANIEALRRLPAGLTFPLTRMSLVLVVLVALLVFDEQLVLRQWLGVLLGFAVVVVLAGDVGSERRSAVDLRTGGLFVLLAILCGTVASVSSKLAAEAVSKSGFMALSYLFGTGFSLGIELKWGQRLSAGRSGRGVLIGLAMGVLNYLGFYAFLTALARGPLSAIALITGMHFIIAILLSLLIYRERMTFRRGLGIGLSLLTVLLLK